MYLLLLLIPRNSCPFVEVDLHLHSLGFLYVPGRNCTLKCVCVCVYVRAKQINRNISN